MGALTSIVIPVTTVLSCGSQDTPIKIKYPTVGNQPLKISGLNHIGKLTMPALKGTTVAANKKTELSNGDVVTITYKLNKGYVWSDKSKGNIELNYTVKDLETNVTKPTIETANIKISGLNNAGVLTVAPLEGTTVTTDATTGLNNGDIVTITYKLKSDYEWVGGGTGSVILSYTVGDLKTGVVKPTTAKGSVTGLNGKGKYTLPTLAGTTVSADKTTDLSNGNIIQVTYKLDSTHAWNDSSLKDITLPFKVEGLKTGVTKPTVATAPLLFGGLNGSATYKMPVLDGTTVTADKDSGTLSNGDVVTITYKLDAAYDWSDGTFNEIKLSYTVGGLNVGVAKPTTTTAHVDFWGEAGAGTFKLPSYKNTNVTIIKGGTGKTPSTGLYSDDEVILSFTPNKGYAWNDGTKTALQVTYKVPELSKAPDGTVLTASNIGKYSTYDSNDKTLTIWNGVVGMTSGAVSTAYGNETSIETLILPNSLKTIPDGAFRYNEIQSLTIGDDDQSQLTSIGEYAFADSSLSELELPASLISIGKRAFYGTHELRSLDLPNQLTTIGDNAFGFLNNIKHLDIPDSVTSIGEQAFQQLKLDSITFMGDPSTAPSIASMAFMGTKISKVRGADWLKYAKANYTGAFDQS